VAAKGHVTAVLPEDDPAPFPAALCFCRHVGTMPDPRPPRKSPPRPAFDDVPEARRRNLSAVRGHDTTPELIVRKLLHSMGYRYRLQRRDLPGRPDIVLSGRRAVVDVRGCFWHRHPSCRNAALPRTRADWWAAKLARNVERDAANQATLEAAGWRVLVVWECEVRRDREALASRLRAFLGPPRTREPTPRQGKKRAPTTRATR
jgi:DNA mismatch endonuclease Vsr